MIWFQLKWKIRKSRSEKQLKRFYSSTDDKLLKQFPFRLLYYISKRWSRYLMILSIETNTQILSRFVNCKNNSSCWATNLWIVVPLNDHSTLSVYGHYGDAMVNDQWVALSVFTLASCPFPFSSRRICASTRICFFHDSEKQEVTDSWSCIC